jgi:uncharacterized protein
MKSSDLSQAEIMSVARTDKGTAVIIKPVGLDQAIPIFIGQLEAHSILIGISRVNMPRPLTHDLILVLMERAKMTVDKVEINDFVDGTFYARIYFKQGVKKFDIDSRPSDALALATRLNIPLFVSNKVIKEAGIPIDMIVEEDGDDSYTSNDDTDMNDEVIENASEEQVIETIIEHALGQTQELNELNILLQEALKNEQYEEAARIRDKIKQMEK